MTQRKLSRSEVEKLNNAKLAIDKTINWDDDTLEYTHWSKTWDCLTSMIVHATTDGMPWVEPEPAKPTYRPFESMAEFMPYRDRWLFSEMKLMLRVVDICDHGVRFHYGFLVTWDELFAFYTLENGEPCGVKVEAKNDSNT